MNMAVTPIMRESQTIWIIVRIMITLFFIMAITLYYRGNPYVITMINLILVWVFEPFDSLPMQAKYGKDWCKTEDYKLQDKIGDMVLYLFVLVMHSYLVPIPGTFEYVFLALYIYRLVGVILYIETRQDIYLVIFANLFSEIIILYIFLTYVWVISDIAKWIILAIAIPAKVGIEAIQHLYVTKQH